jgi:hypothetical protein
MSVWFRIKETSLKYNIFMGIPVKCETKSKRNESKRNEINRNEIYRKETKYTSFCFGKFRFVSMNFVSIYFVSFRFVSFRFRFAFYRYPLKKIGRCFWFSVFVNFPSTNIFVDFFFCRESWWRHCPWIIFSHIYFTFFMIYASRLRFYEPFFPMWSSVFVLCCYFFSTRC